MNELIETTNLDKQSASAYDQARALTIITDADCQIAIDMEKSLSDLAKKIQATFRPHIERAYTAHRALVAEEKGYIEPVEAARRIIKDKRIIYTDEQERLRAIEQARLDAEAQRLEEERILREAEALEREGRKEEAEAVVSEPISAPVIFIRSTVPKTGVSGAIKKTWRAEILDLMALVKAVAKGKVSLKLIEPNMVALSALAWSSKNQMDIPGVRAVSKKV